MGVGGAGRDIWACRAGGCATVRIPSMSEMSIVQRDKSRPSLLPDLWERIARCDGNLLPIFCDATSFYDE